jgi:hypothetical protein
MGPPSEQRGAATCTVEMAHAMGEQRMAKITCTGAERTLYAPPGWWIADPARAVALRRRAVGRRGPRGDGQAR